MDSRGSTVNNQHHLYNLLSAVLVSLDGCQAPTTPSPTATPSPTDTPHPSALPPAAATAAETSSATATPAPCGRPASALTDASSPDPSRSFAKYEPRGGLAYFGFTCKLWDLWPAAESEVWGDTRPFAERICDSIEVELDGKTPTIVT